MNRAVITATSLVAPQGLDEESFWSSVVAGKSAIGTLKRFDASASGCFIGGEVPDFDTRFIPAEMKPKRMARHTLLLLKAASRLKDLPKDGEFGINIGIATSDAMMLAQSGFQRALKGAQAANANIVSQSPPHAATGTVAQFLGARGEVHTTSTACAAGLDAIGMAARDIANGISKCVVAGGADCPLEVTPLTEFFKSGLASTRNDEPAYASRPFDAFADSGVLSDAAGLVVLEDLESAIARGVSILGEVIGYGSNCDQDRSKPGCGYASCMRNALESAGLLPEEIDYVSAWGPGHPVLDRAEAEAIKEVFGSYAREVPVSSVKGVLGNPLSAAGPAQVTAVLSGFRDNCIPHTTNLEAPLAGIKLNFVMNYPLHYSYSNVLLNAHGIGGANISLIISRYSQL